MPKFRTLLAIATILAALLTGMAAKPDHANAKAADDHIEILASFWCQPNSTQGNGTGVIYNPTTGLMILRPEMATYLAKEGGACHVKASSNVTLRLASPDSEIHVKTNNVDYAPSNYLIATGLSFDLLFQPGRTIRLWEIQIWYAFDSVDPFAPHNYPFGTPAGYFTQTGHAISDKFLDYWTTHGGLAQFGYPISDEGSHWLNGTVYQVQYFERARFEYHPENKDQQYQILLGQFGRDVMKIRGIPVTTAVQGKDHTCWFDQISQHNVCGIFADYWTANGGLPQFGRPLTEAFKETLPNGQTYQVQYFERARFEYHPENKDQQYQILLGMFGRDTLDAIREIRMTSAGMKP